MVILFSALYASSLAGNLVEQLWNFAWPAAVAVLHPSLLPVAVLGFFAKVCEGKSFGYCEPWKELMTIFLIYSFQSSLVPRWLVILWTIFLEFLHITA